MFRSMLDFLENINESLRSINYGSEEEKREEEFSF